MDFTRYEITKEGCIDLGIFGFQTDRGLDDIINRAFGLSGKPAPSPHSGTVESIMQEKWPAKKPFRFGVNISEVFVRYGTNRFIAKDQPREGRLVFNADLKGPLVGGVFDEEVLLRLREAMPIYKFRMRFNIRDRSLSAISWHDEKSGEAVLVFVSLGIGSPTATDILEAMQEMLFDKCSKEIGATPSKAPDVSDVMNTL